MPAFFELHFWNFANEELWVGVGLLCFFAVLIMAGVPKLAFGMLDKKAETIQANLDEAARLRAEAEALLADIQARRAETEAQAALMLKEAKAEAKRLSAEAKVKLEDSVERRTELATRRIAAAEAQAAAEVKAAAAEMASQLAEQILKARLASAKADPAIDAAIAQVGTRLQ
jgi:F-type H+-transporting ATPase subunit b